MLGKRFEFRAEFVDGRYLPVCFDRRNNKLTKWKMSYTSKNHARYKAEQIAEDILKNEEWEAMHHIGASELLLKVMTLITICTVSVCGTDVYKEYTKKSANDVRVAYWNSKGMENAGFKVAMR